MRYQQGSQNQVRHMRSDLGRVTQRWVSGEGGETHVQDGELGENSTEFHVEKILGELDLSHVD
jgi:hypothetical protein